MSASIPNAEAELFVANSFDPSFCPRNEAADFGQTPVEYCKSRGLVETNAYQQLSIFQGRHLPKFYGRYRYPTGSGEATAILLQYILDPPLVEYALNPLFNHRDPLSETELLQIFDVGAAALDEIHSQQVYHYDIQSSILYWNSNTRALRIADWEFSHFDGPDFDSEALARSDWMHLPSTLEVCAFRDLNQIWQRMQGG